MEQNDKNSNQENLNLVEIYLEKIEVQFTSSRGKT